MAKVSIIDWIVKKLKRCIAIVEDGDTASQAIASGKYVIWKGNAYKASTAISQGDTLSLSNLTAVSDGIGNELNSNFTASQTTTSESLDCGQVSGAVTLIRCGKIRQLCFDDAKLPSNGLFTLPSMADADCPLAYTYGVLKLGSNAFGVYWIRPAGSFGQTVGASGALVDGVVTWVAK